MLKLISDRLSHPLDIRIDQLLAGDALRLRPEPGARAQQLVEHRRLLGRVKLGKR
jgi:hypothetical protein